MAGERVGVKDIYDLQGLKSTRGSLAWTALTTPSNKTAPAISRIVRYPRIVCFLYHTYAPNQIELGGITVGKQKTTQFASAAEPYDWEDAYPPRNPRGDGWLTCSGSSAGGGASIASYDWLDYAIRSDTGSSMRRPAAVSGVYGNRPSQGLMVLDHVMPISFSTDAAGIFSRNPYKWAKFAKHWYIPELHQEDSITGLPKLEVLDTNAFPKRVLYPVDFLPYSNPAAEIVLQNFISNLTQLFNMTKVEFSLNEAVANFTDKTVANYTELLSELNVLWSYDQIESVGKPLIANWAARFGGYPPIEQPMRTGFTSTEFTDEIHSHALQVRRAGAAAFDEQVLGSSSKSCSKSILVHDIGYKGKPAFRSKELNEDPGSDFLIVPGTAEASGNICPFFGCADFTVPVGEVLYFSNVTMQEEVLPVTVNLVVRRGCDFVLYNLVEKLADAGVLKTVKVGKTSF